MSASGRPLAAANRDHAGWRVSRRLEAALRRSGAGLLAVDGAIETADLGVRILLPWRQSM